MLNPLTKIRYALPLMMLLFAGSFTARSQHYPVQVNTMVTPPYSARLSDYVESGFDRVQVIINPLDMSLVSYKVKIKLIIESLDGRIRIQTDPNYLPPPLYLNGGVTEIITSYDVQSLFDANHLIFQKGITKNEYLVNKKLPENYYRIGFVLLDYNRSTMGGMANEVAVSNFGYTQAGIFLNDPPMLNMPANSAKLTIFEPQQIVLQWTPRHRGSPNSAFSAEYVVKLYEVWNENYSAAAIVQTQMPIFENVTSDNRYIYGIADPMLIPGKKYVWTVQARDADGRDMFRNNGLSEAYMFTWGEACKLPADITGTPVNGPGIELQWSTSTGHTDYDIQYRPAGGNINWYEQNSLLTNAHIYSLKYNTTYETRVRANCGTYSSEYTQPLTIKMPAEPERNFSCGAGNPLATITSTEPMTVLPAGIIFYAGGFRCEVIEAVPANGGFTGTCLVEVPFYGFAKVLHTFKGIRISNDLQMFSGKLVSVTDTAKNSALTQRINDAEQPAGTGLSNEQLAQNLKADTTIVVDGTILTVTIDSATGNILVTTTGGGTEIIELNDKSDTATVTDSEGKQYEVSNGIINNNNTPSADNSTQGTTNSTNSEAIQFDVRQSLLKIGYKQSIPVNFTIGHNLKEIEGNEIDFIIDNSNNVETYDLALIEIQPTEKQPIPLIGDKIYVISWIPGLSPETFPQPGIHTLTFNLRKDNQQLAQKSIQIEVLPKYQLKELTATDASNIKRIAKTGETLYLVGNNNSRKIRYNCSSTDNNSFWDEEPYWKIDHNILEETGKILEKTEINWPTLENASTSNINLIEAYAYNENLSLNVEWLRENKRTANITPLGLKQTLTTIEDKLNDLAKFLNKNPAFQIKAIAEIKFSDYEYNKEDNDSRLYFKVRESGISGGIKLETSDIPIPGINYTIPKVATIGAYFSVNTGFNIQGNLVYNCLNTKSEYELKSQSIKSNLYGGIKAGVKAAIFPDANLISLEVKGYASTNIGGVFNYKILPGEDDQYSLKLKLYPLILGYSIQAKISDWELVDYKDEIMLFDTYDLGCMGNDCDSK